MPKPSPAAAQLELTLRLRARRTELGLPIREVSGFLDFTPNYYSAVENGRTLLAAEKLADLCRRFEFNENETKELLALRELAREPRWTTEFAQILTDELALFYGLEETAWRIRSYEGRLIPGLLQSDSYAVALMRDDPDVPGTRVQKRVELRQRRRKRLFDTDDPLHLTVLIGQGAILQQIGGAKVLHEQIEFLLTTIKRLPETLDLRIIPFESSPRGMVNASTVHLLEFESLHLPVLSWREAVTTIGISDEPDLVDLLEVNFDRASASALSRDESVELLTQQARKLAG